MKRILFFTLVSIVALFSFLGCDENKILNDEESEQREISLILNNDSLSLSVGESNALMANVKIGDTMVGYKVTWSTDNASIAEVDTNGVVTALAVGTAIITVRYRDVKKTCRVVVNERPIVYEYVDLGLSVKWAIFNVGATKPEEYGDYFAWGETETLYKEGYAQEYPLMHWKDGKTSGYTWANYKFRISGNSVDDVKFSKYNTSSDYGTVDNKTILDASDDVANVKWGGSWRMPTMAEQNELIDNCTWTWTTVNGIKGWRVTGNKSGYTDRSIFLPTGGWRFDTRQYGITSEGYYWTSSTSINYPYKAMSLYFDVGFHYTISVSRYEGRCVRPVCP